jgi:perosamine synthetase
MLQSSPVQLGVGTFQLTEEAEANVLTALRSGRLSYGPFSRKFEREFAALHDSSHAVLVNSGTSALSIAVACLKETEEWKDGDEILVPALTFVATANVVLDHNLVPVFVDCDSKTYNIDPEKLEEKITSKTKGIMVVHLFGLIADVDPIMAIAKKHHLRIIEDSCETMGVSYNGKMTGSFGDISCFSTYVAHLIVTGVGGLAVTSDAKYAEILRSLANHGRDSIYMNIDDDKDIDGSGFQEVIRRRFHFVRRGYSFRATELEAALGVAQLHALPSILSARQKNATLLLELLRPYEKWLQLPSFDSKKQRHAFMMFPIVIHKESPFTKEELVYHLEKWNVETRDMLPLINQPVYDFMHVRAEDYPVATWVNTHGFYVGCHQGLSVDNLRYMADVFAAFFSGKGLVS